MTLFLVGSKVRLLSHIAFDEVFTASNTVGIVTNNFSNDNWVYDEGLLAGDYLAVRFEGQVIPVIVSYKEVELVPHKPTEEEIDELI